MAEKYTVLDRKRVMLSEWYDEFNPFNSKKAMIYGRRFEGILNEDYFPPVVVNLDVTSRCQYKCVWCHHRRKQIGDRDLPDLPERLLKTFPYFVANWKRRDERVLGVCIVGSRGDALLYKGLPWLLRNLHYNNIDVGLVTNGYGFNTKLINHAVFYSKFIGMSVDAGEEKTYQAVHNCPPDGWKRILLNIEALTNLIAKNELRNDVGYKFLIFPQNQYEVYSACRIARETGCRYIQIRPADLPESARQEINVDAVNDQIQKAMSDFTEPGKFDVVGVRHKFTPDLKKRLPKYCYLTALTVTITCDGKAWPCVDRRYDEETLLADCGQYGWQALKEVWGSQKHIDIVHRVINRGGKGPDCNIRCSNYGYDVLFTQVFSDEDKMDRRMI